MLNTQSAPTNMTPVGIPRTIGPLYVCYCGLCPTPTTPTASSTRPPLLCKEGNFADSEFPEGRPCRRHGRGGQAWLIPNSRHSRTAQPDLPPIDKFGARTAAKRRVGAGAISAFQIDGVTHLPHFARSIDDDFVQTGSH